MLLEGKVAIVTGAGAGLGRAIAFAYAREGARVVVADVADDAGNQTVDVISNNGGTARFAHTDVSSPRESHELVNVAVSSYGRLDIACNNAGIAPPDTPTADVSDELWRKVLSVDLDGVFYGVRSQIPAMLDGGGGTIVNMASILGQVAFPGLVPYVAAKHAVVGITKEIALEYGAQGIRAISLGPSFIKTGLEQVFDADTRRTLDNLHPVGRMGEPEEVSEVAVLLSSDKASYVNGAYLPIDGGYLTR